MGQGFLDEKVMPVQKQKIWHAYASSKLYPFTDYVIKAMRKMQVEKDIYLQFKKNPHKWHSLATTLHIKGEPDAMVIELAPQTPEILNGRQMEFVLAHEVAHVKLNGGKHSKRFDRTLYAAYPLKKWGKVEESLSNLNGKGDVSVWHGQRRTGEHKEYA